MDTSNAQAKKSHPQWHRVAKLKPRLRPHISFHRHIYRGQRWYVIRDESSARSQRFTPEALSIIQMVDGVSTVQTIYDKTLSALGDRSPSQDEFIRLFTKLHSNDLVIFDNSMNTNELIERQSRYTHFKKIARWWSPLSLRFPLYDPDIILNKVAPVARKIFTPAGLFVWLLIIIAAGISAIVNMDQLNNNMTDAVLAPDNLIILLLVYPIVKLFHEAGHALAIKVWGGEVHEIGIMMLVLIPVPYVEASAASAFAKKQHRFVVDAAGIIVELFLASIALLIWLNIEPGLVRSVAFNVVLIGSVSTLFFNGNPLLRFDGYYMLADWIEIPNLAKRSTRYIGYLIHKHLFRIENTASPVTAQGEAGWLFFYGIAAFLYRLVIASTIILFVAGQYFFIGVLLAIWAVFTMLVQPLLKQIRYLLTSNVLAENRSRAITTSSAILVILILSFLYIPMASWTNAEGVVWMPDTSHLRPKTNAFITSVAVTSGSLVEQGDLIFETTDPLLLAEKSLQQFQLKELQARYTAVVNIDQTESQLIKEQIYYVQAQLNRSRERIASLSIKSPLSGYIIIPHADDLIDRYAQQGRTIAYVVNYPVNSIRVAVTQEDIGRVRSGVNKINLRYVNQLDKVYQAKLGRQVPAATNFLPSAALGKQGGGLIAIDPASSDGTKSFESVFLLDIEVEPNKSADLSKNMIGDRVYVRFEHDFESIGVQVYRRVRQLFLSQFDV